MNSDGENASIDQPPWEKASKALIEIAEIQRSLKRNGRERKAGNEEVYFATPFCETYDCKQVQKCNSATVQQCK